MQKFALPLVACLFAIAATSASAAPVWKWRDASGQLHISDTPPPSDVPDKNILQRAAGGSAPIFAQPAVAAASATSGVDSELQKKKSKAEQEKAEKEAADKAALEKKNAAVRADNCQRAQTQ